MFPPHPSAFYNCRCSLLPMTINVASHLLEIARAVRIPKRNIICMPPGLRDYGKHTSLVNTALRFEQTPPALRLQAILEEWDLQRIIREVY